MGALRPLVTAARIRLTYDVSEWTLNRWIREEGFPVEPFEGIGRRFDPTKVEAWFDARRKVNGK